MNFDYFKSYEIDEYPEVKDVNFPKIIKVAYMVCSKECNHEELVVEDSSEICQYCGKRMKKVLVMEYELEE